MRHRVRPRVGEKTLPEVKGSKNAWKSEESGEDCWLVELLPRRDMGQSRKLV